MDGLESLMGRLGPFACGFKSLTGNFQRERARRRQAAAQGITSTLFAWGNCVDGITRRDVGGVTELRIKHGQHQKLDATRRR